MPSIVRLFVNQPLSAGQLVPLTREQAHYLFGVMRLAAGDALLLFNGVDGEWQACVHAVGKRGGALSVEAQTQSLQMPPDLWLLFAPVKKARTDFIVEKAIEMGVARILPVLTEFTNSERVRQDRLQAHAVEAAEQCGATYVPEVVAAQKLSRLFDDWAPDRRILFCDEARRGEDANWTHLPESRKWAVLIGPEGGFSPAERNRLLAREDTSAISLGPRVLRADTAAVAALALWQRRFGDWQ